MNISCKNSKKSQNLKCSGLFNEFTVQQGVDPTKQFRPIFTLTFFKATPYCKQMQYLLHHYENI